MHRPSVPEVVSQMLSAGFIENDDARKYLENYSFFEQQRPLIEGLYNGLWVASLGGKLYYSQTRSSLRSAISDQLDANRAYMEHVIDP